MDKFEQFFEQEGITDGKLTPEQAAQLMALSEEGDTDALSSEQGGAPDAAQEPDQQTVATDAANTDDDQAGELTEDPGATRVMAKDNIHTIPYEKHKEYRDGMTHWKGQATELQAQNSELQTKYQGAMQELETLRAQPKPSASAVAQSEAAAVDAALEAGLNPDDLLGDFSAEAIVLGMKRVFAHEAQNLRAELMKELRQEIAPIAQERKANGLSAHFAAIEAAHPDRESLVESQELRDWMDKQVAAAPSFQQAALRASFEDVLSKGTATEVIELFDAYKATQKQAAPPANARAAAQQAIASTKTPAPASLSDIPGAAGGAASEFEVLASLSPIDLAARLDSMPPEKVEAFLNTRM